MKYANKNSRHSLKPCVPYPHPIEGMVEIFGGVRSTNPGVTEKVISVDFQSSLTPSAKFSWFRLRVKCLLSSVKQGAEVEQYGQPTFQSH